MEEEDGNEGERIEAGRRGKRDGKGETEKAGCGLKVKEIPRGSKLKSRRNLTSVHVSLLDRTFKKNAPGDVLTSLLAKRYAVGKLLGTRGRNFTP